MAEQTNFPAKRAANPRRLLASAAVVAVLTDVAARRVADSLSGAAIALALAVGLMWTVQARAAGRSLIVAAAAFAPWLIIRDSAWLAVSNVLAMITLLTLGADVTAGGPLRRRFAEVLSLCGHGLLSLFESVRFVGRACVSVSPVSARRVPWWTILRATVLVVPVLWIIGALLVNGDALFASLFSVDANLGSLPGHVLAVVLGVVLFGALAVLATAPSRLVVRQPRRLFGEAEALAVLIGIAALFAAFAAVQLSAIVAGDDYVRRRTGLTYAEYARRGFFQLMTAAVLAIIVLMFVRLTVQSSARRQRVMTVSGCLVAVLTVVLLISVISRIALYSDVFGLTHLRLYTVVAAGWLAVVVVVTGCAFVREQAANWLPTAALLLAAACAWAMNVVNPDALVADVNISRAPTSTSRFDDTYLGNLSADAIPTIVERIDEIPAAAQAALREVLCAHDFDDGWLSFNWSRSTAADALAAWC